MKLLGFGKESLPSVINDPFGKNNITSISVRFYRSMFDKTKFYAYGSVDFENGKTKGTQEFKGETFDEVVLKIKSMMDNVKN